MANVAMDEHAGLGAAIAAARAVEVVRCPWCDIFVRSAAGTCTCTQPCGSNTCPLAHAFVPPAVPVFRVVG